MRTLTKLDACLSRSRAIVRRKPLRMVDVLRSLSAALVGLEHLSSRVGFPSAASGDGIGDERTPSRREAFTSSVSSPVHWRTRTGSIEVVTVPVTSRAPRWPMVTITVAIPFAIRLRAAASISGTVVIGCRARRARSASLGTKKLTCRIRGRSSALVAGSGLSKVFDPVPFAEFDGWMSRGEFRVEAGSGHKSRGPTKRRGRQLLLFFAGA
jgi:hypothetical protein